jgi:hypothetical protein
MSQVASFPQNLDAKDSYPTWRYLWRVILYRPGFYVLFGFVETLFFVVFPQLIGLITRAFFDSLTGSAPAGLNEWSWIAILVAVTLTARVATFSDIVVYFNFRFTVEALLRKNMFEHIRLIRLVRRSAASEKMYKKWLSSWQSCLRQSPLSYLR